MAVIKYNGLSRRRVTWNSMGKGYSYVVDPNDKIVVPEDQINNACACAPFIVISSAAKDISPSVVVKPKKIVEPVVKTKKVPVVVVPEPVVEVVPEVVVEEPVVEVTPEEEFVESEEYEDVVEEEVKIDYTSIRKADLKKMCSERNLDTHGNRDDLIARLVMSDQR